ncbi:MAG: Txe/YoeB family addiction module toxin [Synechococcaceae cyanobacterium SM1_2_3]|nr:Txe/YoeB family addiction module toxin [Synechococcaceae cyanobacterium SM1_2_3]
MTWTVILSRQATKDARRLAQAGLKPQAEKLLNLLAEDPFLTPPHYEKLVGNLAGFYSRRINIQHRLIYQIDLDQRTVHVLRLWTHYE